MKHDYIIVGGGIVGAATAYELLQENPTASVLVLDKEDIFGKHQTGHNSGVIHSGIYYEPGSLKAVLCKEGVTATKDFAAEHGIPVEECGKLLVATNAQEVSRMDGLLARARQNAIDAELIDAQELRRREPHIAGLGALAISTTAITDYAAITRKLAELISAAPGGEIRSGVEVIGIKETTTEVSLRTTAGEYTASRVVFCAGLQADRVARMAGLEPDFRIVPFRGEYYDIVEHKSNLTSTLIYPIPDPDLPFLGVHLTPTVYGGLNVGPNAVLGLSREGYRKGSFDWGDVRDMLSFPGMWRVARDNTVTGLREMRNSWWKRGYLKECQKYCPSLRLEDLVPREAGIRAQAVLRSGEFVHDFLLRETGRTLHVVNAPSPAATSAFPIARKLVKAVGELAAS